MKLALNYSHQSAVLLQAGRVMFDLFKCPPDIDLITVAQRTAPVYVHLPLKVGMGAGDAVDSESQAPPDWAKIETLLSMTGTPLVNLHLRTSVHDYPDESAETQDPAFIDMLTERMIADTRAVVKRFGPERVIVENVHPKRKQYLRPAYLAETMRHVVEETGCGLLLDVAHALMAAKHLELDPRDYIQALPVEQIREIHVAGVQRLAGQWIERLQQAGIAESVYQPYVGQLFDHYPLTDEDFDLFAWVMKQVHQGAWGHPWAVTFEYGGVGELYELVTLPAMLAEQIPLVHALVQGNGA